MNNRLFKFLAINTIWWWLFIFAFIPNIMILIVSFMQHDSDHLFQLPFTINNYLELINSVYFKILLHSLFVASICTFFCVLLGYPFAYLIAQTKSRHKNLLLLLVIIPFWTSSLIRTYAIMIILKTKGLLNSLLLWIHLIHEPLHILYTNTAVYIGLVYTLLPFMILPLYANIEKLDKNLIDAAKDLGATKKTTFIKIILPLTMPGIIAGIILVFLPAMTMFYIPVLLGGAKSILLGNLIQNQFLQVSNWPLGSAISVTLLLIMSVMILIYWRHSKSNGQAFL